MSVRAGVLFAAKSGVLGNTCISLSIDVGA